MRDIQSIALLLIAAILCLNQHTQRRELTVDQEQGSFSLEQEIVPVKKPATLSDTALKTLARQTRVHSCLESKNLSGHFCESLGQILLQHVMALF